ncbi:4-hydroxybenzoyl-CoA thioesterase [Tenuifilaceae bacterium CYCD]|nr:4-hydroxybenzoyl-CoA thioesterase [Tenuifilaceae bacterium CYCD]
MSDINLVSKKVVTIRFNEVDSMGIVWHGSYVKYFEDGREAFGKEFNIGYLDIFASGFYAPLVCLDFNYKKPLIYGDEITVITKYINTEAAKIMFEYEIVNNKTNEIVTTGKSTQVFLDKNYQLILYSPEFYVNWKKNHHLL